MGHSVGGWPSQKAPGRGVKLEPLKRKGYKSGEPTLRKDVAKELNHLADKLDGKNPSLEKEDRFPRHQPLAGDALSGSGRGSIDLRHQILPAISEDADDGLDVAPRDTDQVTLDGQPIALARTIDISSKDMRTGSEETLRQDGNSDPRVKQVAGNRVYYTNPDIEEMLPAPLGKKHLLGLSDDIGVHHTGSTQVDSDDDATLRQSRIITDKRWTYPDSLKKIVTYYKTLAINAADQKTLHVETKQGLRFLTQRDDIRNAFAILTQNNFAWSAVKDRYLSGMPSAEDLQMVFDVRSLEMQIADHVKLALLRETSMPSEATMVMVFNDVFESITGMPCAQVFDSNFYANSMVLDDELSLMNPTIKKDWTDNNKVFAYSKIAVQFIEKFADLDRAKQTYDVFVEDMLNVAGGGANRLAERLERAWYFAEEREDAIMAKMGQVTQYLNANIAEAKTSLKGLGEARRQSRKQAERAALMTEERSLSFDIKQWTAVLENPKSLRILAMNRLYEENLVQVSALMNEAAQLMDQVETTFAAMVKADTDKTTEEKKALLKHLKTLFVGASFKEDTGGNAQEPALIAALTKLDYYKTTDQQKSTSSHTPLEQVQALAISKQKIEDLIAAIHQSNSQAICFAQESYFAAPTVFHVVGAMQTQRTADTMPMLAMAETYELSAIENYGHIREHFPEDGKQKAKAGAFLMAGSKYGERMADAIVEWVDRNEGNWQHFVGDETGRKAVRLLKNAKAFRDLSIQLKYIKKDKDSQGQDLSVAVSQSKKRDLAEAQVLASDFASDTDADQAYMAAATQLQRAFTELWGALESAT